MLRSAAFDDTSEEHVFHKIHYTMLYFFMNGGWCMLILYKFVICSSQTKSMDDVITPCSTVVGCVWRSNQGYCRDDGCFMASSDHGVKFRV